VIRKAFLDLLHLGWALIVLYVCGTFLSWMFMWISEGGRHEATVKYILSGDWLGRIPW